MPMKTALNISLENRVDLTIEVSLQKQLSKKHILNLDIVKDKESSKHPTFERQAQK